MVKNVFRRFLATLMALVLIVTLVPDIALAANVNTGVTGLTAVSGGSGSWSESGGTITGSVQASSSSGCSGTTYTAQTATLTFTNSSGAVGQLSFDYTLTLSGGSAKVDGAAVTAGTSFSKTLGAGETVAVSITSPKGEGKTSMAISNLKLTAESNVSVTFKAPANGSYTVDGTAITADTVKTVKTTASVALAATPASGCKFFGWYSSAANGFIAFSASVTTSFSEATTVEPRFVPDSAPVFQVGSMLFTDLNEAIGYAQTSGTAKIALISDGTLPAGDYTIPSGKTLLIPFDEAQTLYTTTPEVIYGSHANPSAFRTLTMAKNAKLTVANGGAISVPSKLCATGTGSGSWNGTPTGKHGRITMNEGSSIDVQSGGKLYVYGYISGSGSVYARSGSEIWETFQIRCWRGGTATSGMADNSQKVFPLNQYYVQNIEAPTTYYPGAVEKVYTAVNMSNKAFAASATFIGSGGMFNIDSGSATKRFTGATDRLELTVDGNFRITPMSLRITGLPLIGTLDLNTADYVLPIQSNITLNVNSGTTTLSQDVAFLPGSEMSIANGATVTVANGSNAYVYDQDQWGAYAASGSQLVVIGYSTVNGTTAKRTAASLTDVKIDVNGTLNVAGALYTTESGAAIISSAGTGKVVLTANAGTQTKTYMATQSGSDISYVAIPITAAKLQNANGSYLPTAGKATGAIPYEDGWWGGSATATFQNYDGTELASVTVGKGMTPEVPAAAQNPTRPSTDEFDYEFSGWVPALGAITADTTYVAQFTEARRSYTVTFYDEDGATVLDTRTVEYGATPVFSGDEPVKAADAQYTYTFAGWEPELGPVSGDTSYKATYTGAVNEYTVIWQNEDGTELEKDENVPYGATPTYDGADPVKASDAQYDYTFSGWNKEVEPVTGDVTYIAAFSQTTREYTITWIVEGTQTTSTVKYGEVPVYAGADPARESTAEFDYNFTGWSPELTAVTGEATYTAQFEAVKRGYTITWKNEDGSVIDTTTVAYGETPTHADAVKADDAQYSYTFVGWTPEITSVVGDASYTAVFQKSDRFSVTFFAPAIPGTELVQLTGGQTDSAVVQQQPNYPSYTGRDFTGVTVASGDQTKTVEAVNGIVSNDALNNAIAEVLAASGLSEVTVTANYEAPATYTVNLKYQMPDGEIVDNFTTEPYNVGSAAKLTTSETFKDGDQTYYFDHWLVNGKEYNGLSITVRPEKAGSYDAVAVYVADETATNAPVLEVVNAYAETQNGVAKTAVTLNYSVPDGCTVKAVGFRVSTKDPTLQTTYSTSTSKLTTQDGAYTVHINVNTKRDKNVYVCAYLTYIDNGTTYTITTDPAAYKWSAMNQ